MQYKEREMRPFEIVSLHFLVVFPFLVFFVLTISNIKINRVLKLTITTLRSSSSWGNNSCSGFLTVSVKFSACER